ncbi:MAG: ribosome recycling factor [Parcubacteria group bacterium Gr01-1014_31]|nr:MAG: ribosome recycling factor [Parcubacteria group bacterium Gr01-1014_31]
MQHPLVEQHRPEFDAVIEAAKAELGAIRTGRANPMMVEHVQVEAYGARTPLKQLASVTVPEPSCVLIEPWDKGIVKDVERALVEARLGLTPSNEGNVIRLRVPPLTSETRAELVRVVSGKAEQLKTRLRGIRDAVREAVGKAEKAKEITQDDRYQIFEAVDKLTKEYTEKLKGMGDRKTDEINTI